VEKLTPQRFQFPLLTGGGSIEAQSPKAKELKSRTNRTGRNRVKTPFKNIFRAVIEHLPYFGSSFVKPMSWQMKYVNHI
jgi:hypothetical protein